MEYLLKPLRLGDQPAPTIVLHKDSRRQLIPQEKFELYVKTIHEQHGHEKAKKLTERMRRDYHLTEVEKRKITQIISECKVCRTAVDLVNQEERYELRPQQATEVNQVWVCDFAVYEQVSYLAIIDVASRYAFVRATDDQTSNSVLPFLTDTIAAVSEKPVLIHTDGGSHFTSGQVKEWAFRNKIYLSVGSAYRPQTQGVVERFHQTFKKSIRKMASYGSMTREELNEKIMSAVISYNTGFHSGIRMSPSKLYFQRQENNLSTARQNLRRKFGNKKWTPGTMHAKEHVQWAYKRIPKWQGGPCQAHGPYRVRDVTKHTVTFMDGERYNQNMVIPADSTSPQMFSGIGKESPTNVIVEIDAPKAKRKVNIRGPNMAQTVKRRSARKHKQKVLEWRREVEEKAAGKKKVTSRKSQGIKNPARRRRS